jgi:hypothetical protein
VRWQAEFVEQLLLRQAVGNNREHIAVHKRRMTRQLAGQRGFRPAFDLCGNHALGERHRFRVCIQPHGPHGDAQRFACLAQHATKLTVT